MVHDRNQLILALNSIILLYLASSIFQLLFIRYFSLVQMDYLSSIISFLTKIDSNARKNITLEIMKYLINRN